MKKFIQLLSQRILKKRNGLLIGMIFSVFEIFANDYQSITGKLIDQKSKYVVPYAVVSLIKTPESVTVNSVYSDTSGLFTFKDVAIGNYKLTVTIIGYKPASKFIVVNKMYKVDAGIIYLEDTAFHINETVILGERLKAKSENDKTTFFVTKKMLEISSTGVDILKLIPGVQFDLNQKITLQGSPNVLIYVDGKERDRSYLNQLNPDQIEKVEVLSAPPSNFDGYATGVINIVLKKDRDNGLNGQILFELPTSTSEIYIFPMCNINFGYKKLNLYTSYNGEIAYFDVHENTSRAIRSALNVIDINSDQYVNQKDWSHKFHYGLDYLLSSHDQINFYAFYNPFSDGRNGNVVAQTTGNINKWWQAKKEDTNINLCTFYSMYYKHMFMKDGQEIALEINNFRLKADNSTDYIYEGPANKPDTLMNIIKPNQNSYVIKIDFTTPIWDQLKLSTGIKAKFQELQDRHSTTFDYNENIFAVYGTFTYTKNKIDVTAGLRVEKSVSTLKNSFSNPILAFLPYASLRYKLNGNQHIQLGYNSSIQRPDIYQLNPYTTVSDPYTVYQGNPLLRPEIHNNIFIEHSVQFNSNYFSSRLFYNTASNVINNLTFINDTNAFETQVQNLGTIHYLGVQFLGTFKFGIATINPYLRSFEVYAESDNLARKYDVMNRQKLSFESGLSTVISFKGDVAVSLVIQYATPKINIQDNSYCDPLYFLSIEKTLNQKLKIGVKSFLFLTRTFIYQGSDVVGSNFNSHYEGTIKMNQVPFMFSLNYQFNSGKNRMKINHNNEVPDQLPKKGF